MNRVVSPFGEFFLRENYPLVSRALAEGRFNANSGPDEWEITPEDAWQIRDYCEYVIEFYRSTMSGSPSDVYFFSTVISKVDSMLAGGGWLWNRPSQLEEDILNGDQLTFDIV